ncbi:hypothetical protein UFOVP622_37 [uncultured Caudovirales phage]|uniref:Uncharacterized protein n=1 Tax=uncultured Caudovirales phage TaxID=2100421 RepID=A0A6J5N7P2_9CAUD|nr:hypothetical protein UFOVP622_37 [uncultured Caudovirales phage]
MNVEIEFRELKLRVDVSFTPPTFEEEENGISGQIEIESIKLEDSEIDILDILFERLDYIKLLISEQL